MKAEKRAGVGLKHWYEGKAASQPTKFALRICNQSRKQPDAEFKDLTRFSGLDEGRNPTGTFFSSGTPCLLAQR